MVKSKIKKILKAASPTLISIGIGLIFGFLVMLITAPQEAFQGLIMLLTGGLSTGLKGIGDVLYFAGPYILAGLAVGFAFKTGLFNIGASGQIMIGGFVALYIGINVPMPSGIHYLVALVCGVLAGAIVGAIPGILKAFFNVNEVVTCIMLNYATLYYVMFQLVQSNMVNPLTTFSKNPLSTAYAPNLNFDQLFNGSSLDISIFIALIIAVVIHIILNKTTLGYELKAVGYNPQGSKYAGINNKRNMIISMAISGALAGLAGVCLYLNPTSGKRLTMSASLLSEGFDGITVSLLGASNPIGIFFSGLFISYIRVGGSRLQLLDGISPEIISIITATIIYLSALSSVLQRQFTRIVRFIKEKIFKKKVVENTKGGETE